MTAHHSGDVGDVIYAIPVMLKLGINKIILDPEPNYGTKMNRNLCHAVGKLLQSQGISYELANNYVGPIDYDFDKFRSDGIDLTYSHLSEAQAKAMNVEADLSEQYIEILDPIRVADIVISRSARYHNHSFDWYNLLKDVKIPIAFVGLKQEYESFLKKTMLRNVSYYPTDDFYHLARVIAGAKVFIGNQSAPFAVAEGLKVHRIQETFKYVPNCKPMSDNGISVITATDMMLARLKFAEWFDIPCDIDVSAHPRKNMLVCTAYVKNDYQLKRIQDWIEYYSARKEALGIDHICIVDDGSPMEWVNKLSVNLCPVQLLSDKNGTLSQIEVPTNISKDMVNWIRFPYRLGRPNIFMFPGWWRSYSFIGAFADFLQYDKFIFIESDAYVLSGRMLDYLRNAEGYGAMWSQVSGYPETSIQWCDKNNFHKVSKYFTFGGRLNDAFWWGANLHGFQYLPEHILPFNNDFDVARQFKGDRYGDDHYEDVPNECDFICNVTDISLNGMMHRYENDKSEKIKELIDQANNEFVSLNIGDE
ncbi:hypothetical protein EG832_02885 [bacterium]|nr:hypothetical protein [bacterium]